MFTTEEKTKTLIKTLDEPFCRESVERLVQTYQENKKYFDPSIFYEIRDRIERKRGERFNLKKRLEKAEFGRFLVLEELSHRKALPEGWSPVFIISPPQDEPPEEDEGEEEIKEERDRLIQSLREYENFCRLLLVGKILPKPVETNGLENSPLLRVFGGARSLQEVHRAYRELRKAWHPDISPFSEKESNDRFYWLKKAYQMLTENWSKYDPQNLDIPPHRVNKLLSQQLIWSPESFWYW